jgi:hypothetical protein
MIWLGDREYRVRGLAQNTSPKMLKMNLRVLGSNAHGDMALHVDTLEMSSSRQRMAFSKQAAEELHCKESVIHGDLGKVLIDKDRAWKSATHGRGPWWNGGATHMNHAYPKK